MKLSYTTNNGRMTVELEADSQAGLFKEIAQFQEIFEINTCQKCGCSDVQYIVRQDKDENEYFELRCNSKDGNNGKPCRAKFTFGQAKKPKGTLFPKRKDGETWLNDGGWLRWNSQTSSSE